MAGRTGIEDQTLTEGELAGLLRHFNVRPPEGSPLAALAAAPVDLASMTALRDRGLLEQSWGDAAKLLAAAGPAAVLRQAYVDGVAEAGFYAGEKGGALVRREESRYRLSFPLRPADAMSRLIDPLDPIGAAPPAVFDRTLSSAGLTALAAATDQLRSLFAASLLQRQGLDIISLRVADVAAQLAVGSENTDNRSLVCLFGSLLPGLFPAPATDLEIGLFELTNESLLRSVEGRPDLLLPHPSLVALANNLMSPVPAASLSDTKGRSPARFVLIRGASLWRLEPLDDGRFRLRGVDGLAAVSDVMAFFGAVAGVKREATDAGTIQVPSCPSCGSPLKAGAKFCRSCGADVRQAYAETPKTLAQPAAKVEAACASCGAALKPGAKFCGSCGTAVSPAEPAKIVGQPPAPAEAQASCPSCGTALKPGAKFCKNCGHKVETASGGTLH